MNASAVVRSLRVVTVLRRIPYLYILAWAEMPQPLFEGRCENDVGDILGLPFGQLDIDLLTLPAREAYQMHLDLPTASIWQEVFVISQTFCYLFSDVINRFLDLEIPKVERKYETGKAMPHDVDEMNRYTIWAQKKLRPRKGLGFEQQFWIAKETMY